MTTAFGWHVRFVPKADIQAAFRYYCWWARVQVRGTSPVKLPRRQFLHLAAGAAVSLALPRIASALDYPTRPVRWIVGFLPGGPNDITARLMADQLSVHLHQPFVVENRPGASSNVATEMVAILSPAMFRSHSSRSNLASGTSRLEHCALWPFRLWRAQTRCRTCQPWASSFRDLRPALGRDLAHRSICPPSSSTRSTRK